MRNLLSDRRLQAMYAGGRANAQARRLAHLWAGVFGLGLLPKRWVALEVTGRRSGRAVRFPVGMADWNGQWYLVSMLGEDCNWVQNVRAANGRAVLRRRRAVACHLTEVPAAERPAVIRRYLQKVPGGRPHIPVSEDASLADFQTVSPRYPVFRVVPLDGQLPRPGGDRRPPRRRHWWRWVLAAVPVLAVLAIVAGLASFMLQPSAPPLALPGGPVAAPAGPVSGAWDVAAGSVAGFRIRESALGMGNDVTGRTHAVTGTLVISGSRVTAATFHIDLTHITVNDKTQPQFARSLDTRHHPIATFTLVHPVTLRSAFSSGAAIVVAGSGRLTLRGTTRLVTFTLAARRDGTNLQAAGSIPVAFPRWGITQPTGYGIFGSLASHGTAEFRLLLHRLPAAARAAG